MLRQHQKKAVDLARNRNLLLAHDCGTGKTLTAIEIIKHYKGLYDNFQAIVVCPLSIINNAWISDLKKFAPELTYIDVGNKGKRTKIDNLRTTADIHLINFEQFRIMYEYIRMMKFHVMIVDESSKMKSPKTQISKAIRAMGGIPSGKIKCPIHEVPHKYCLSGTPAPNDESEYWSQIAFLDKDIFGSNFYDFRRKYFNEISLGGMFKKFVFRKAMRSEFLATMAPVINVVQKEEAFDVPDIVDVNWEVELSQKEQDAYHQMCDTLVLELEDATVLGRHHLTQLQKLRQIACGFVYTETGEPVIIKDPSSKMTALHEVLDHLQNRQVVIWSGFTFMTEQIGEALGDKVAIMRGTQPQKDGAISRFLSGDAQYIVAHPASGAHGLNLQYNAAEQVDLTPSWSWELTEQSRNRILRMGQESKKVTYYNVSASGTIDKLIQKSLQSKQELCSLIKNHLQEKSNGKSRN